MEGRHHGDVIAGRPSRPGRPDTIPVMRSGPPRRGTRGTGASRRGDNSLRARLADARLYLCMGSRRAPGDLVPFLDAVLASGVDIVQLREKGLEAGEELALLEVFAAACARHGALLAVNDRADVALAAGADVLHLGQDDLPVPAARRILGPGPVIGRSSHSPEQSAAAAIEEGIDYFCAGPVWETPTKAGRPGTGTGLLSHVALLGATRPWFAIGGISFDRLDAVLERARPGWSWSGRSPRRTTRGRRPPRSRSGCARRSRPRLRKRHTAPRTIPTRSSASDMASEKAAEKGTSGAVWRCSRMTLLRAASRRRCLDLGPSQPPRAPPPPV